MLTTLLDSYVKVTVGNRINNHMSAEMRATHPVNSGNHHRSKATNYLEEVLYNSQSRPSMYFHHYAVDQNY